MKVFAGLVIVGALFFISQAHGACPEPLKSGYEAYQCILEQNPRLQPARYRNAEFQALSAKAKQIPNPELDGGIEFTGEKKLELSLLQPIELGGKRKSRTERARAENAFASAKDLESRIEVSNAAIESLIRFRQLQIEKDFARDSLLILNRITHQLKKRAALSPEHKTALRLFSTFAMTLQFRQGALEREHGQAIRVIESAIGRPLNTHDHVAVGPFQTWPELNASQLGGQTIAMRMSVTEAELARAELNEARSASWTDLKLGPGFERMTLEDETEISIGIKAGITVPLWNLNGAGRNLARIRLTAAEATQEATKRQETAQMAALQKQYEFLTKLLEQTEPISDLIRSVKDTEGHFNRTLISPASLIEMYRSSFELIEEVHRNEIHATLIWATFKGLSGTFPEELP